MFFNVLFFLSFAWAAGVAADSRLSLTLAKLLCITTNKPKTQIEYISQPLIHSLNVIVVSRFSLDDGIKEMCIVVARKKKNSKKKSVRPPGGVYKNSVLAVMCLAFN